VADEVRGSERWGAIKVTKKQLRVDAVEPEAENERSDADEQMTEAFRAFADDASSS
jgi:hypothetical protein